MYSVAISAAVQWFSTVPAGAHRVVQGAGFTSFPSVVRDGWYR